MACFGFLLILGIPLASFFFRMIVSLAGGYKIPLAWISSYYFALSIVFTLTFIRSVSDQRNKARWVALDVLLSVCLGSAIGFALAKAGVLGGSRLEDPSGGNVTSIDVILNAAIGSFCGLGLGLGNSRWAKVLAARGMRLNIAATLPLSATFISVGTALSFALIP